MKALSIRQPWATLIVEGYKTIELRTWERDYRGPLLIHTSKNFDKIAYQLTKELFPKIPLDSFEYPQGAIIAKCELVNIICLRNPKYEELASEHLCPLSHYYYTHYGWILTDIKKLDTPTPYRGQLGLWNVDLPGR